MPTLLTALDLVVFVQAGTPQCLSQYATLQHRDMSNNEKITICVADNCLVPLPEGRKKYCSDRCSKRTRQRAWRASKPTKNYHVDKAVDENVQKRRGDYYAIMKKKNFTHWVKWIYRKKTK